MMTEEEFERALHALSPQQMREMLASEVLDENGRTTTLENLLAKRCIEAARHPGIPKAERDRAFRLAKAYVRRTTLPVVIERVLHVVKGEDVKEKTNE